MSATVKSVSTTRQPDYINIGLWVTLLISCVLWSLPFVFVVLTSLKSEADISTSAAWALPTTWEWGNYTDAAARGDLLTTAGNSAMIALVKVPLGLLVSASAAFALARLKFRRSKLLLIVITLGAMLPVQIALGPLFGIMSSVDLLDSRLGLILPYLAFGISYQIFFLYGFFKQIPEELDDAARIDGAGNFGLFFRIALPLAIPALAALFILDFVATWNEYAMALTLLPSQENWTIPLALQGFSTQFTSSYGPMNAFIIMSIFPVLVVYLMFQRFFTSGALAGAVKG